MNQFISSTIIGLCLLAACVAFVAGVAAIAALPSVLVWLAWKLVAVVAFHAPALSFLQVFLGLTGLGIIIRLVRGKR